VEGGIITVPVDIRAEVADMKKFTALFLFLVIFAPSAFAEYIVVLTNGTRYKAKEKWRVVNGKAILTLDTGAVMQIDPALIDAKKTDEVNRLGLGDVNVIAVGKSGPATPQAKPESLGSIASIRKIDAPAPAAGPGRREGEPEKPSITPGSEGYLGNDVASKFVGAYENVGLFESNVAPSAPYTLRIELTTDNEDQVFKALSATAWVMLRVPSITGSRVDMVELFMGTMTGGAAGRFKITPADAEKIDKKQITLADYFVQNVLF
jgi:hypothetical protein